MAVEIIVKIGHEVYGGGTKNKRTTELQANKVIGNLLVKRLGEVGFNVKKWKNSGANDPNPSGLKSTAIRIGEYARGKTVTVLDIHHNAFNGSAFGFECFGSTMSDPALGKLIASKVKGAGFPSRGFKQKDYWLHSYSGNAKCIILEGEFMDNLPAWDKYWARKEEYVESVVKAMCEYYKVSYTKPVVEKDVNELSKFSTAELLAELFSRLSKWFKNSGVEK